MNQSSPAFSANSWKLELCTGKKKSKFGVSISVFVVPSFPCLVYPDKIVR